MVKPVYTTKPKYCINKIYLEPVVDTQTKKPCMGSLDGAVYFNASKYPEFYGILKLEELIDLKHLIEEYLSDYFGDTELERRGV